MRCLLLLKRGRTRPVPLHSLARRLGLVTRVGERHVRKATPTHLTHRAVARIARSRRGHEYPGFGARRRAQEPSGSQLYNAAIDLCV